MVFKLAFLLVFIGPSQLLGYEVIPKVINGVPDGFIVNKAPFVQIGDGYYYFERNLRKNWFDAFESCRRMDASLIAFETKKEWDSVNQYIKQMNIVKVYWTSGTDLASQGKHKWFSTGKPLDLEGIWYSGEPNNFGGNERCDELGHLRTPNNYNDLNDRPCDFERNYICEAQQPKTAAFVIW